MQKIYLETTMFSFYFGSETTPEYRQFKADTQAVFDLIKAGKYEAFTSPLATDELADEPDVEKRFKMLEMLMDINELRFCHRAFFEPFKKFRHRQPGLSVSKDILRSVH